MVSCKGANVVQDLMLTCVRWYVAYPWSYRHLEEIMQERGGSVAHATIPRWGRTYRPRRDAACHSRHRPVWGS
jgi:putative transposase